MSEWQPIETAPKDGRDLLLWDGISPEDGPSVMIGQWVPRVGSTRGVWVASYGDDYYITATHWMPLPEPPDA